jgi:hypothetical protein
VPAETKTKAPRTEKETNSMTKRTNPGSYLELRMWAEAFADAQFQRIAFENRQRSGTIATEALAPTVAAYKGEEERLRKEMVACYRATVPAGVLEWQESSAGIGESTLARLLGITGDPKTAYPRHWEGSGPGERHLVDGEPFERAIGQLWQYCGHGAPKNRKVKGDAAALMANGSPDAKKLVHLLATAQVKSNAKGGAAYRHVYDENKAKYQGKVHSRDCEGGFSGALYVKCKTHQPDDRDGVHVELAEGSKKLGYALAGDPYQPSHIHAIALRHTGKEILRDLWLASWDGHPPPRPEYAPKQERLAWPAEDYDPPREEAHANG